MVSHLSMVSRKNVMIRNFMQSRDSINFSCIILEIQNAGQSQRISHVESQNFDDETN
ncbi:hypothetical protein BHM03_00056183 [Ensete ventricosum]|nr:hypothetical protein BHM03_00056183 [Ensete ventricosum]